MFAFIVWGIHTLTKGESAWSVAIKECRNAEILTVVLFM